MAEIPGARRSLWRATYAPVRVPTEEGTPVVAKGVQKRAFVAALRPMDRDVDLLRKTLQPTPADAKAALDLFESVAREVSAAGAKQSTARAAAVGVPALVDVARRLVRIRAETIAALRAAHQRIWDAYRGRIGLSATAVATPTGPGWQPVMDRARSLPHVESIIARSSSEPPGASGAREEVAPGERRTREVVAVLASSAIATATSHDESHVTLAVLLDWADANAVEVGAVRATRDFLSSLKVRAQDVTVKTFGTLGDEYIGDQEELVDAFSDAVTPEPVGFLHLERLSFIPAAIERGELLYCVPLAPGEEVNIAHKEWSQTSEEFSKIVTDSLEDFSEEGVTEKSEITQAASSERTRDTNISTGVSVSGGYGPVSIAASANYDVATSSTQTEEYSRNHSIALTRKASSRTKREHKVSFKVASAAGTEDQTIRKIKNPFTDRATRVDYYRLLRKWRVNLFRYGVRMTYDLTIPEPGSDVLSRIREVQELRSILEQGFDSPSATVAWARFDLRPVDITRANYLLLAAQYNASVEPPPPDADWIDRAETKTWTKDDAKHAQFHLLEVDVADDYLVHSVHVDSSYWFWTGESYSFHVQEVADFIGKSGSLALVYQTKFLSAAYVELRVALRLRPEALDRWRMKAWTAIRDAAQARYYEARQLLKERLERLTADLGAQDALSLRKFERDEIMKGVLRWLLGPSFQFNPLGVGPELYGQSGSVVSDTVWTRVSAFGEMIKFLHQAIEWENVLYFLYPYFWSHRSRWDFKKYLDHPDPFHRAFLKAGSARVVLTVRPGFELAFAQFVENGGTGELPNEHPYVRIAEEIEAYARTNYPGIPPANPDEADAREQGILIGTWFEYTPTSALDIAFDAATPDA
jgi:hypothetical protein